MSNASARRQAIGRIEVTKYDAQPFDDNGSFTMSVVTVVEEFAGDLTGGGASRLIIATESVTGALRFTGIERFSGRLHELAGSFLFENSGSLSNGALHSSWRILPGSGTGELKGLRGEGTCSPDGYQLTYWLELLQPVPIDVHPKR